MIKVVILGFGNVGQHLTTVLHKAKGVQVLQIYNRNQKDRYKSVATIPFITNIADITKEADCYFLALPDDCIASFSETLQLEDRLVAHTSGGANMNVLSDRNRKGVFYPLQTFSANREVNFKKIPICIEAQTTEDKKTLITLARTISKKVEMISSEERALLHLSAVFVNNFVNYMYGISATIMKSGAIDFSLLQPLIEETATKIRKLSPAQAQTGPAKRNDQKTIQKHLLLLEDSPHKEVYTLLTQAIANEIV